MEYRENWCSDTSSRGSLKACSILPWKSFEHLSLKQGRNQKQRLMRLMHHSVLYPKLTQLFIIQQQNLVRLGACLTWQQAAPYGSPHWGDEFYLLDYYKHMPLYNCLQICMNLPVELNFVFKLVLLCCSVFSLVLSGPLLPPCRATKMLLFLSDAHSS